METYTLLMLAVGAAIGVVGSVFCVCQFFRLIQTDAVCRGFKHPNFWGVFAISGNNSSGLLLYLLHRRKHPIQSMTEEQQTEMTRRKTKIGVGTLFLVVGAILCIWGIVLM